MSYMATTYARKLGTAVSFRKKQTHAKLPPVMIHSRSRVLMHKLWFEIFAMMLWRRSVGSASVFQPHNYLRCRKTQPQLQLYWLFGVGGVVAHKIQDMSIAVHVSITLSWCMYVIRNDTERVECVGCAMVCGIWPLWSKRSELDSNDSVAGFDHPDSSIYYESAASCDPRVGSPSR